MDRFVTIPGVIFTVTRNGGGYLTHCLDSHPEMIWDTANSWSRAFFNSTKVPACLLQVLLMRPFAVSGTKLVTGQALRISMDFWKRQENAPDLDACVRGVVCHEAPPA